MTVACARTIALVGLTGYDVQVQVQRASGLPAFHMVGLPDTSVKEAKHRVRAALAAIGISVSDCRHTINLAPAAVPKAGTSFDLAIAVALIAVAKRRLLPQDTAFLGELSLDARVVPVRGILPMVKAARDHGVKRVILPAANQNEAELIPGIEVIGIQHLYEIFKPLRMRLPKPKDIDPQTGAATSVASNYESHAANQRNMLALDLADVVGQDEAKFALEVVAAGGHNWMLNGLPGSGKTMLAQRLPTVLPQLDEEQALEVAAIRSIVGQTIDGLDRVPPFEAPHHGASFAALIGGGNKIATPGAISRCHHGVLFLDEAPEFAPRVLDGLREVMESGQVRIDRVYSVTTYPAQFQLVLAANPCPCGNHGLSGRQCGCSPTQIYRYQHRISGPLLDRIDLVTTVAQPKVHELVSAHPGEPSAVVRDRVEQARCAAAQRWKQWGVKLNARVPSALLRSDRFNSLAAKRRLLPLLETGKISMRGADKVRRIAWTLSDLDGRNAPDANDYDVAVSLRRAA